MIIPETLFRYSEGFPKSHKQITVITLSPLLLLLVWYSCYNFSGLNPKTNKSQKNYHHFLMLKWFFVSVNAKFAKKMDVNFWELGMIPAIGLSITYRYRLWLMSCWRFFFPIKVTIENFVVGITFFWWQHFLW